MGRETVSAGAYLDVRPTGDGRFDPVAACIEGGESRLLLDEDALPP